MLWFALPPVVCCLTLLILCSIPFPDQITIAISLELPALIESDNYMYKNMIIIKTELINSKVCN